MTRRATTRGMPTTRSMSITVATVPAMTTSIVATITAERVFYNSNNDNGSNFKDDNNSDSNNSDNRSCNNKSNNNFYRNSQLE
jgi:hypothetical protein